MTTEGGGEIEQVQKNWRTAGEDEIRQIIHEIGQAAITSNGGYITEAQVREALKERRISTQTIDPIKILKDTFQREEFPPRELDISKLQKVYDVNRPVIVEPPADGRLFGIADEIPLSPPDYTGRKIPRAPHSE